MSESGDSATSLWQWLAALLLFAVFVAGLVGAITETVRSWQVGAGRRTRIRRAGGKDALRLLPFVGGSGGHGHSRGDGDDVGSGSDSGGLEGGGDGGD